MKLHLLFIIIILTPQVFFAQGRFTVSLRVNDSTAFRVFHNEPVVFSISLVNEAIQHDIALNENADAYLAKVAADYKAGLITKEEYAKETDTVSKTKRIITSETVGSHESPWFTQLKFRVVAKDTAEQRHWKPSVLGDPDTDSIAVLDEKGYYTVDYHLSPEQVSKIKPGTYKIQVTLAGITSNEVSLRIKQEDIPHGQLNKRPLLLRLGDYYLATKDAKKALYYANLLVQKNPSDISGYVMRGEAYILQQQYKSALAAFTKARQLFDKADKRSPSSEPPLYLIATIAWLQKKL